MQHNSYSPTNPLIFPNFVRVQASWVCLKPQTKSGACVSLVLLVFANISQMNCEINVIPAVTKLRECILKTATADRNDCILVP